MNGQVRERQRKIERGKTEKQRGSLTVLKHVLQEENARQRIFDSLYSAFVTSLTRFGAGEV
jgi:hypothetical protein